MLEVHNEMLSLLSLGHAGKTDILFHKTVVR